ncbi:MAG: N-6 DNA methylase [Microthrixaceae bacterium]
MSSPARAAAAAYELRLTPEDRTRLGAHSTPPEVADELVELALAHLRTTPGRVVDPACGAGAFLLAAADALVRRGVAPVDAVGRLRGTDVDPGAVGATREHLVGWLASHGVAPGAALAAAGAAELLVHDSLGGPPEGWVAGADLLVANPPFRSPLSAAVAARAGAAPYTNDAARFLAGAADWCRPGGVAVVLQPLSVLGARDAAGARDDVLRRGELVALWASPERLFDAEVRVCAPVLRRRAVDVSTSPTAVPAAAEVEVAWTADAGRIRRRPTPAPGSTWGPLLAGALGIPEVPAPASDAARVASVASATAGFRDEYYGLLPAVRGEDEPGHDPTGLRVATVGMIGVARLDHAGRRRLGGRAVAGPRIAPIDLATAPERVAAWAGARLRPKVLVATQSRVLEAVADPDGDCVPLTPVISVEPLVTGAGRSAVIPPTDLWSLLAALSAPSVSALAAAEALGSGMSSGAVRWSTRAVTGAALPTDVAAWARGAVLARRLSTGEGGRAELLARLGRTMAEAHGLDPDHPVVEWWIGLARRT